MLRNRRVNQIIDSLDREVDKISILLSKIKSTNGNSGFISSRIILVRLRASFLSLRLLIKNGYLIEPLVLIRFCYEQISYAYSIRNIKDIEEVDNIKVTECLKKFKIRDENVGKAYGELSRFAHLGIEKINHMTDLCMKRENKKGFNVILFPEDARISYDAIFGYCYAVLLYMDSLFWYLEVDGLGNENPKLIKRKENIQADLCFHINEMFQEYREMNNSVDTTEIK